MKQQVFLGTLFCHEKPELELFQYFGEVTLYLEGPPRLPFFLLQVVLRNLAWPNDTIWQEAANKEARVCVRVCYGFSARMCACVCVCMCSRMRQEVIMWDIIYFSLQPTSNGRLSSHVSVIIIYCLYIYTRGSTGLHSHDASHSVSNAW